MTQMLDILGDYLTLRGIAYYRIDGHVPYAERQEQVSARGACCRPARTHRDAGGGPSADSSVQSP
jgi:hypothetical protein